MSRYMEVPLEGGQPAQVQVKAIYDRFGKYKKELGVLCSCLCLGIWVYVWVPACTEGGEEGVNYRFANSFYKPWNSVKFCRKYCKK